MKNLSPHALGLLRALDVLPSVRQLDQAAEELIGLGLANRIEGERLAITPSGRERAAKERDALAEKAGKAKGAARKNPRHRAH
jgi:hypothetical protein